MSHRHPVHTHTGCWIICEKVKKKHWHQANHLGTPQNNLGTPTLGTPALGHQVAQHEHVWEPLNSQKKDLEDTRFKIHSKTHFFIYSFFPKMADLQSCKSAIFQQLNIQITCQCPGVSPLITGQHFAVWTWLFFFLLFFPFFSFGKKSWKMNILALILSSKYFFKISVSQTFPCQGPPTLHAFGRRPSSREKSFQGRPEAEIWDTKVSLEKYIFKYLNKSSWFFKNSRSRI